jgi:hypothetical protein
MSPSVSFIVENGVVEPVADGADGVDAADLGEVFAKSDSLMILAPQNITDEPGYIFVVDCSDEQGSLLGDPGRTSGLDVTRLIANQYGIGQVEIEVVGRGKDQPRLRLATLAVSP